MEWRILKKVPLQGQLIQFSFGKKYKIFIESKNTPKTSAFFNPPEFKCLNLLWSPSVLCCQVISSTELTYATRSLITIISKEVYLPCPIGQSMGCDKEEELLYFARGDRMMGKTWGMEQQPQQPPPPPCDRLRRGIAEETKWNRFFLDFTCSIIIIL